MQMLLILWFQGIYHQEQIKESLFMKVITTCGMIRTSSEFVRMDFLRRCELTEEGIRIIERCHLSPYGGYYGTFHTHAKSGRVDFSGQLYMKT
jgi:hypothetical protein